jgi:hypothetical protein
MVEKFSIAELSALRTELLKGSLDSFQVAELFNMFLRGRGYGVSSSEALNAVLSMEGKGCSLEALQHELERLAWVQ